MADADAVTIKSHGHLLSWDRRSFCMHFILKLFRKTTKPFTWQKTEQVQDNEEGKAHPDIFSLVHSLPASIHADTLCKPMTT